MNKIWTAMVGDNIRVFMADTSNMVKKAADIHKTSGISTVALARTLTGTSILGKTLKNDRDMLTVKVAGSNQIKTILATTDASGHVKGYISDPDAELPTQNHFDKIGKAIGLGGSITVIRDFGLKEPYIGMSHLIAGEIDEDIAFYFKNSEQQPSWMKLDCQIVEGEVLGAGGFFIQSLPDITAKERQVFMDLEDDQGLLIRKLYQGAQPQEVLKALFPSLDVKMTGEFEVDFRCDCSKERIARALLTIGYDDLNTILVEDGQAEINCHFCNTNYHFDDQDLRGLINLVKK